MTREENLTTLEALLMWSSESYHGLGELGSTKTPDGIRVMTETLAKELSVGLPDWFYPEAASK